MRIALIVVACLAFVAAGCGGSSGKQTVSTDTTVPGSTTSTSSGPATTTHHRRAPDHVAAVPGDPHPDHAGDEPDRGGVVDC